MLMLVLVSLARQVPTRMPRATQPRSTGRWRSSSQHHRSRGRFASDSSDASPSRVRRSGVRSYDRPRSRCSRPHSTPVRSASALARGPRSALARGVRMHTPAYRAPTMRAEARLRASIVGPPFLGPPRRMWPASSDSCGKRHGPPRWHTASGYKVSCRLVQCLRQLHMPTTRDARIARRQAALPKERWPTRPLLRVPVPHRRQGGLCQLCGRGDRALRAPSRHLQARLHSLSAA